MSIAMGDYRKAIKSRMKPKGPTTTGSTPVNPEQNLANSGIPTLSPQMKQDIIARMGKSTQAGTNAAAFGLGQRFGGYDSPAAIMAQSQLQAGAAAGNSANIADFEAANLQNEQQLALGARADQRAQSDQEYRQGMGDKQYDLQMRQYNDSVQDKAMQSLIQRIQLLLQTNGSSQGKQVQDLLMPGFNSGDSGFESNPNWWAGRQGGSRGGGSNISWGS